MVGGSMFPSGHAIAVFVALVLIFGFGLGRCTPSCDYRIRIEHAPPRAKGAP